MAAAMPQHQAPVGRRVEPDRGEADDERPYRPLKRADEGPQYDEAPGGQQRPLQSVDVRARQSGQARILTHREQQLFAPPEREPERHGQEERRPQADAYGAPD